MTLRKIKLYGELAKFVGKRVLYAEVATVGQAIRFLCVNFKGIERHMKDQYYKVSAGDWQLEESEIHYPTGQSDISIVPVVGGAGNDAMKIIIGVALVAGAFYTGGATFSMAAGLKTTGFIAQSAVTIGSMLVLSGVSGLLAPVPEVPSNEQDPRRSFSFSGIQNTSRAGVAVPIIYGSEVLVGSVVFSAAIDTVPVEVAA